MEHVKSKNGRTKLAEHGENDDDDVVHLDSSTTESFHDSNYNFSHDDEDVTFQSCIVALEQELGSQIGKIQPDRGGKAGARSVTNRKCH